MFDFGREPWVEGDTVYLLITLATSHRFSKHYRPRPYFILQSTVQSVDGDEVAFDTFYKVKREHAFRRLPEAKERLALIFTKETDGTLPLDAIRLVSHEEEASANKVLDETEGTTLKLVVA